MAPDTTPLPLASGQTTTTQPPSQSPFSRQIRQVGLYLAGAGFLAASVAVSRRSVIRMRAATIPPFYVSNRAPINADDKGIIAARALGLATLNVMSFGVMLLGGIGWAFDLTSMSELRERTQAQLTKPTNLSREDEDEVEEEMNKMIDSLYEKLGMTKPPTTELEQIQQQQQKQQDEPTKGRPVDRNES
ncbi:hypothetical protein GMORB2_5279 [Geosmithia morbida]|uniref:Altered inheritance of mitochondria protein 11 n=1 Tax=Geosmithia morbida TaxID=1094350 RepID=A0A9P4YWZ0_9HYPO|nr:uncharacterized protein GMORB2_5279 [Geosmithia morbida]KAF4124613.1 hypothetical protein GMORB2_5279 [Geosmithia morbida]